MSATHTTSGRSFHTQMQVPLGWDRDGDLAAASADAPRLAACLVRGGSAVFCFAGEAVPVMAPAVVLLDEQLRPAIQHAHALRLEVLYFHPAYINRQFTLEMLHDPARRQALQGSDKHDFFLFERFVKLVGAQRVFPLAPQVGERVIALFDATIREADLQPDKFWPCRTRSYLIELLFQLRLLEREATSVPAVPESDSHRGQRMTRALSFVQEHYQREFTLGDLARACATNRTTLNEEFRAATGMTVRAYTIGLRMKMAAALLRDTRIPVGEVMTRVGYENQSHFTRAFRQNLGETPRDYRSKYCIV